MYNQDPNTTGGNYASANFSPQPISEHGYNDGSVAIAPTPTQDFQLPASAPTRLPASLTSLLDPPNVVRIAPRKARPAAVRLGSHSARYDPHAPALAPAPAPAFKPAPIAAYRPTTPAPVSAEPLAPMAPSISISQTTAKAPWQRAPRAVHTPIRAPEPMPNRAVEIQANAYAPDSGLSQTHEPVAPISHASQATTYLETASYAPPERIETIPAIESFHENAVVPDSNYQYAEIPQTSSFIESSPSQDAPTLASTLEAQAKEILTDVAHHSSGSTTEDSQQTHMTLAQRLEAARIARISEEIETGFGAETDIIALDALSSESSLLAGAISSQGISRAPRMAKPAPLAIPDTTRLEPAAAATRIPVQRARPLANLRPVEQLAPSMAIAQETKLEIPASPRSTFPVLSREFHEAMHESAPRLVAQPIEPELASIAVETSPQANEQPNLEALARQYQALVGIESALAGPTESHLPAQGDALSMNAVIEAPSAIESITEQEIASLESASAMAERKIGNDLQSASDGPKKAAIARRPIPAKGKIQAKPTPKPVSTARNAILGFFLSYAEQFERHIGGPLLTIWRNKYVFLAGFMHVLIPLAMAYFFANWNSATQAIFFDGTPVTILGKLCWLVVICGFLWTLIFMVASRIASTFKSDASRFERIGRGFNSPHNDE